MNEGPFLFPLRNVDEARAMIFAVVQLLDDAGLMHRPPPPVPSTCCGRGCNGCVWEGYFSALQYWREQAGERLAGLGADRSGRTCAGSQNNVGC